MNSACHQGPAISFFKSINHKVVSTDILVLHSESPKCTIIDMMCLYYEDAFKLKDCVLYENNHYYHDTWKIILHLNTYVPVL